MNSLSINNIGAKKYMAHPLLYETQMVKRGIQYKAALRAGIVPCISTYPFGVKRRDVTLQAVEEMNANRCHLFFS